MELLIVLIAVLLLGIALAGVRYVRRARNPLMREKRGRQASIAAYRLNIDRYRRMLRQIEAGPADDNMRAFAAELRQRLAAECAQCAREELIIAALDEQIEEAR